MMWAEDIRDEDSLKAWLETQPRKVSVLIASRAALRVMPVWAEYCLFGRRKERDLTPVPVLRANLIAAVAALSPTDDMKAASASASTSASASVSAASAFDSASAAARAAVASATDASAAARAAVANATAAAFHPAVFAAFTGAAAGAAAHAAVNAVWSAVKSDALAIEAGEDVTTALLWPEDSAKANPLADLWHKVATQGFTPDSPYDFWRRWYESLLDPARHPPMPHDMLYDIALIDPKIWQGAPEDLAREIAGIEARYRGAGRAAVDHGQSSTALVPETLEDMLERNAKVVLAQLQVLRLLVEEELSRFRATNGGSEEGSRWRERRIAILEDIAKSIQRIGEALAQDSTAPGTALVAISEELPAIADKAEELADNPEDVPISAAMRHMAAVVKHLTDSKVPGSIATGLAAVDYGVKKVREMYSKRSK